MLNFSNDPVIRHYVDVAHAERSRAITGSFASLLRVLNPLTWVSARKGPALSNQPL